MSRTFVNCHKFPKLKVWENDCSLCHASTPQETTAMTEAVSPTKVFVTPTTVPSVPGANGKGVTVSEYDD